MNRMTWRSFLLILAASNLLAKGKPSESFPSPTGNYSVELSSKPMRGADTDFDVFSLVLLKNKKPITMAPTYGYLTAVHWSPDGKYVAVNNRRGNSGDYVWVFRLPDGRLLKRPGDVSGETWQRAADRAFEKNFPTATGDNFIRCWVNATGWKGDQLEFVVRSIYQGNEGGFDFEGLADPADWSITSSRVSKKKG